MAVGTTTSASDAFRSECDFGLTHYGESDLHGDGLGQDGDEVMFLGLLMDTNISVNENMLLCHW